VQFSNDNTNGAIAHCLDPLDLAYAKLAAGRPKDLDYVVDLARYHFIRPSALTRLIEVTEDPALKQTLAERWQVIEDTALFKPALNKGVFSCASTQFYFGSSSQCPEKAIRFRIQVPAQVVKRGQCALMGEKAG
jgi:hypothetical protein